MGETRCVDAKPLSKRTSAGNGGRSFLRFRNSPRRCARAAISRYRISLRRLRTRNRARPFISTACSIFLQGAESLGPNEKIVYIGHGRFAVMVFENPSDLKKFRIVRTIDWENSDTRAEWRNDISGTFQPDQVGSCADFRAFCRLLFQFSCEAGFGVKNPAKSAFFYSGA